MRVDRRLIVSPRRRSRLGVSVVFAACLMPAAGGAQTVGRTVPSQASLRDGSNVEPFVLSGAAGRTQVLIRAAALTSFAKRPIRRVIFRRDAQTNASFAKGFRGGWIDLQVIASWTQRDVRAPSASFAANHAATKVVVYQGAYHVPDSKALPAGTRVASLGPNVSANIVLQKPIAYVANRNLCLEFVHRPHATKPAPGVWLADLDVQEDAAVTYFGRSCFDGKRAGRRFHQLDAGAQIGGTLVAITRAPVTPLALLAIGASNQRWGALRLPFDLGTMGAANCRILVSLDLRLVTSAHKVVNYPGGRARQEVPIPFLAGLVGSRLYTQWFFYDAGANSLSLTVSNGASVRLAAAPDRDAAMVQATGVAALTGTVFPGRAPVIRLLDH